MNKEQLIGELSARTGYTLGDCALFVDKFCDIVFDALRDGDYVKIVNFGVFRPKQLAARSGKNFHNNGVLPIPPRKTTTFTPGLRLRDLDGGGCE